MPITLPTTTTSTNPPPSPPPRSSTTPLATLHPLTTHLRTQILRPLTFQDARDKGATATVVLRGVANTVHFVLTGGSPWWAPPYYVLDQLVVMYMVGVVAGVRGGRKVGRWRVDERFFEYFLAACGVVHVLYLGILLMCVVTLAIAYGVTGGFVLTIAGAAIVPVALLAALPEDGEGGLSLP
ncbi:hypothetical protein F5144DRAFT_160813 [Chaetomium tenue]|uniref:Uncharacterized protein n=1 Tax=Chaetomium tenue TaxID=1854479 RepID=A0ACB7PC77_9PEZI|nr:hypothetical protein F5144DRAFT_160813 [Chaetomium globosum]